MTMNRSGKKCVLYPRVSTEMQVDGFSLDGQKNSLKRFADREEMEIVNIYEDAGKSGKSIDGRPAFKQMLFDIENEMEIEYILVYKAISLWQKCSRHFKLFRTRSILWCKFDLH